MTQGDAGGTLPFLPFEHVVTRGPEDVGSEQRWRVRLADGRNAVVGQLAPELARDESLRRRYVGDLRRQETLQAVSVIGNFATGPQAPGAAEDPRAEPPWRARLELSGVVVEDWLAHHAPAPLDVVCALTAAIADAQHAVHARGGVLREVSPRTMIWVSDGRVFFVDAGLARVDILSSHTASSLLLQGSAYGSPEQLRSTVLDQRSDIYGLGVILWRALTGTFPFGDGPAFLRESAKLPSLTTLRQDVPAELDALARSCLADDPAQRPESAAAIAQYMRGQGSSFALVEARTVCQHCGASLKVGQRLCLACGRVATKFGHLVDGNERYAIDLMGVKEDAASLSRLHEVLASVIDGPLPALEFIIGDPNMYSEEERLRRIRLPQRLFDDLAKETAEEIAAMLRETGVDVRVLQRNAGLAEAGLATALIVGGVFAGFGLASVATWWLGWLVALPLLGYSGVLLGRSMHASTQNNAPPMFRLRVAPAALPASDPLVARLAALLQGDTPSDVRAQVGELALLVQRLVDHRATLLGQTAEVDMLTAPIEPLVGLIEQLTRRIVEITVDLKGLQEGAMVRALAVSEARGDPQRVRDDIHAGLDRLRTLEDERAAAFHRLLECASLLRRAVKLGLGVHDARQLHEHHVQLALAALEA